MGPGSPLPLQPGHSCLVPRHSPTMGLLCSAPKRSSGRTWKGSMPSITPWGLTWQPSHDGLSPARVPHDTQQRPTVIRPVEHRPLPVHILQVEGLLPLLHPSTVCSRAHLYHGDSLPRRIHDGQLCEVQGQRVSTAPGAPDGVTSKTQGRNIRAPVCAWNLIPPKLQPLRPPRQLPQDASCPGQPSPRCRPGSPAHFPEGRRKRPSGHAHL